MKDVKYCFEQFAFYDQWAIQKKLEVFHQCRKDDLETINNKYQDCAAEIVDGELCAAPHMLQ